MIKLLLQSISLFVVGFSAAWMVYCFSSGRPYLGLAGLLIVTAGHSVFIGVELVLNYGSQRRAGLNTAATSDLMRAWLAEGWCALRAFLWRQPFRSNSFPDSLRNAEAKRGLLLLHGFVCNRGVWNGWYPRLLEAGYPFVALNLEPAFGSIDDYVGQIDKAIERLRITTGLAPIVVAHSMGGLAIRSWLRDFGADGLQRIHRVVTLGTPHYGTALVKLNLSRNVRQMAVDSGWLRSLAEDEHEEVAERFICVFSRCDNVVFPAHSACLDGAESAEIVACAHLQMVDHPVSYRIVNELLAGTRLGASSGDTNTA